MAERCCQSQDGPGLLHDIPEIPASPQCPGRQSQPPTWAEVMETSARAPAPCKLQVPQAHSPEPWDWALASACPFQATASLLSMWCFLGTLKQIALSLNLVTNAKCQHLKPVNTCCLCCHGNRRLLCFNIFKLETSLKPPMIKQDKQ